jgi:co-chaperonin GroES (HSP10)
MKLLHDNILVRIKKETNEYTTASGIYISGVEHDFVTAEIVKLPELTYYFGEDDKKLPIDVKVGDIVVLEKNFHHVYNIESRNRIDHTFFLNQDEEYNYYLTKYSDILLVSTEENEDGVKLTGPVIGTLYSIMHQLAGTSIKRTG